MIQKLPLSLMVAMLAFASYGQTIVSTSPENRKVIIEEYTGIHCNFCPSGHTIAQAIQDDNPGNAFIIKIHQGGYANPSPGEPDFRTPYGNAIVGQSYTGSSFGYPSASINRHVFPSRSMDGNEGTAMGRNWWEVSANEILAMPSYVNVAVEAQIESATNIMTIHVEGYYTGDSPEPTNLLNVVILQNNTKGPQIGGNQQNNYNHMYRLVDMVTGQWGEEITETTSGTFFERTYTYEILPHNNNIPVEIGDLDVVAFISETHQEIISGNGITPTVTVTHDNDALIRYVESEKIHCVGEEQTFTPKVNIQNAGSTPITSLNIEYNLNGIEGSHIWTGTLESLDSETISLPQITFTVQPTNNLTITIPNDDNNEGNEYVFSFDSAPQGTGMIDITIITDSWGQEFSWQLINSEGTVVESGNGYPSNETTNLSYNIDADCYMFKVIDSYGDGGTRVTVTDETGKELFFTDGVYGASDFGYFSSNGPLGVNQSEMDNVNLYPNPSSDFVNITNAENANVQVFDILGKLVISKENISLNEQLNISSLNAGSYFVKISNEGNVTTKKLLVTK